MDINLKNYDESEILKFIDNYTNQDDIIVLPNSINYSIKNVLDVLKINSILSPYANYKVTLVFENFNNFNEFLFDSKNFFRNLWNKDNTESLPEKAWSVDFKNSIHITKEIYKEGTSFLEYLNSNLSANEVLNFIFLHELGHSIHSELKKKTGLNFSTTNNIQNNYQEFLNDSIPFTQINSLTIGKNPKVIEKELNLATHYGMKEGFADLYACIAINIIYPNKQAENIIEKIIEGRNYIDEWNHEFYHSKQ